MKLGKTKLKLVCDGECYWYNGIVCEQLAHNNYSILIPHALGKNKHGFLPSCEWIEDYVYENDRTKTKYPSFHTDDIPYKLSTNILKNLLKIKPFKNKTEPYYG